MSISEEINWLLNMWRDTSTMSWGLLLLVTTFLVTADAVLFFANWCIHHGHAREYGYPQQKRKRKRKKHAGYSFWDHLFLVRITREAERKGLFLYFNLLCYDICLVALLANIVGFFGVVSTRGQGWAMCLLLFPQFSALCFTTLLKFFPTLVCLPSERRRYFSK